MKERKGKKERKNRIGSKLKTRKYF